MLNNHDDIKQQFINLLKQVGRICDDTCIALLELFLNTDRHFSVAELHQLSLEKGLKVTIKEVELHLQTYYRYGIAWKLNTDDGLVRYEHLHINEHHDHLICTKCGKIVEFHSEKLENIQERITINKQFYPFYHRLQIYGICAACIGQRKPMLPLSMISIGEKVRIEDIQGGDEMSRRLLDMGLQKGVETKILNNSGAFILQMGEMRLAIGRGMANKIMVSPIFEKTVVI